MHATYLLINLLTKYQRVTDGRADGFSMAKEHGSASKLNSEIILPSYDVEPKQCGIFLTCIGDNPTEI